MAYIFIPTDRIGLFSCQESISNTAAAVNALLRHGIPVNWHTKGFRLEPTKHWPEGHYYQSGFSIDPDTCQETALRILNENNIKYEQVNTLPETPLTIITNKIALYDGSGAGAEFSGPLVEVLNAGGFSFDYISDEQIRQGGLDAYDIFLVPGSPDAGECYYAGLGDLGYDKIRDFIKTRGQYMGICGGAYLPLTAETPANPYWLNLLDATEREDLDYWRSGSAFVQCRIDHSSHPVFSGIAIGKSTSMNLVYWEGPAIRIFGENVRPLAHFEHMLASGCGPNVPYWDLQDNQMAAEAVKEYYNPLTQERFDTLLKNTAAIAEGTVGDHKILLFSPHPEMGNTGYGPRKDSLNFLLIFNGLFYLSCR